MEKGVEFGATLVLDGVALHAASKFATAASRQFVSKAADMFNHPLVNTRKQLVEVVGVGKLALEEEFGVFEATQIPHSCSAPLEHLQLEMQKSSNGGNSGGIIRSISLDGEKNSIKHIFSADHKRDGIMDLGKTQNEIINSVKNIIFSVDEKKLLKEGPNRIHTTINGLESEIKVFVRDGEMISFNAFKGHSMRKLPNTIVWP